MGRDRARLVALLAATASDATHNRNDHSVISAAPA